MSAIDDLRNSNVWDSRRELPNVPFHRNPHIYCADAVRLLEAIGEGYSASQIRIDYQEFLEECEKEDGLLTTLPGSENASHDDVLGAAFLDAHYFGTSNFATRAVIFLVMRDGSYELFPNSELKNMFRFLFFLPAIKSFTYPAFRIGLASQIWYTLGLLLHLWTTKPGQLSGHNKLWLTFPTMMKYPLPRAAILYWSKKQTQRGYTPKTMFSKYYLTECPWFGKWAPDSWIT